MNLVNLLYYILCISMYYYSGCLHNCPQGTVVGDGDWGLLAIFIPYIISVIPYT
jgi:hypothetical protein